MLFRLIIAVATSKIGQKFLIDCYKRYVNNRPQPYNSRKDYRR